MEIGNLHYSDCKLPNLLHTLDLKCNDVCRAVEYIYFIRMPGVSTTMPTWLVYGAFGFPLPRFQRSWKGNLSLKAISKQGTRLFHANVACENATEIVQVLYRTQFSIHLEMVGHEVSPISEGDLVS